MDSDKKSYEIVYCPEDDEYRVYCDICDNPCIERLYKNHLKKQTHTKKVVKENNSKNLMYISMSYYCDVCDETIEIKSENNHFKSLSHKEFDKCKHLKRSIKNPDVNKIDNTV